MTKDISYVIGRLQGLNELVRILKDLVKKEGSQESETITVVVDHIAEQLESILSEFDDLDVKPRHKEALMELKEKHAEALKPLAEEEEEAPEEEETPKEKLAKHEKTVDDLLKDLESLRST